MSGLLIWGRLIDSSFRFVFQEADEEREWKRDSIQNQFDTHFFWSIWILVAGRGLMITDGVMRDGIDGGHINRRGGGRHIRRTCSLLFESGRKIR